MEKCIICGSSKSKIIFKEFDADVLKCQNCGHVFSSYQVNQNYNNYFGEKIESENQFWWDESHRKMHNDFCDKFIVGEKGRLLDVGCGLGYFIKKVSAFPNWQVFGYEISPAAAEFAKNKLELNNIFCGLVEESDFLKEYFDIITLWDVIEHIPEPRPLLIYLLSILKDNGILFIHTPNIKIQLPKAKIKKFIKGMNPEEHYLEARDHINIYSAQTIKKVLNDNGFLKIKFIHLHPIQSVAGSKNEILKLIKNFWFYFSRILSIMTFGKINIDNLFIIAKK